MGKVVHNLRELGRLKKAAKDLDGLSGKVGWFESAKYADGTPVAYVASIQEFGYADGGIPPRPFMRPTVQANSGIWASGFAKGAVAIAKGKFTAKQVMTNVCEDAAGKVRKAIKDVKSPPLAEATVKARLRGYRDKKTQGRADKPLVATALMINSLSYEVSKK